MGDWVIYRAFAKRRLAVRQMWFILFQRPTSMKIAKATRRQRKIAWNFTLETFWKFPRRQFCFKIIVLAVFEVKQATTIVLAVSKFLQFPKVLADSKEFEVKFFKFRWIFNFPAVLTLVFPIWASPPSANWLENLLPQLHLQQEIKFIIKQLHLLHSRQHYSLFTWQKPPKHETMQKLFSHCI